MPTQYKKVSLNSVNNRNTETLTEQEQSQVTSTLTKFLQLFKANHS